MIERHWYGVLPAPEHRLSNAALDSNNPRIRGISQRGHGYATPTTSCRFSTSHIAREITRKARWAED
jgi:hypothetical protein